jgi:hypothetical protein
MSSEMKLCSRMFNSLQVSGHTAAFLSASYPIKAGREKELTGRPVS